MANLEDLDYYPTDGGAPLHMRETAELEDIVHKREALLRQLEAEQIALLQPSDLEERVVAIEGALDSLQSHWDDPYERNASIATLVKDIEAPHLKHADSHHMDALTSYRSNYMNASTPRVVQIPLKNEHPVRKEAPPPEPVQQQSDYIGRKGAFAENYQFVRDPWTFNGGWVAQVPSYYGHGNQARNDTSWHRAQADLDRFNAWEDGLVRKAQGKVSLPVAVADFVHDMQDYRDHTHPELISPGCGDVYVDLARAPIEQMGLRREMARCGVPVIGQPPPVTREWLRSANIWHGDSARADGVLQASPSSLSFASGESLASDRLGQYKRGMLA